MKKIILTGATSGIGLSTFNLLKENNYQVHIISRNEEKMKSLTQESDRLSYSVCDVSKSDLIAKAVKEAEEKMGGIDVLINNSGVGYFDPIIESNFQDWKTMIDVNITGAFNMCHACLPELIKSNGQIINITSVASHNVFPNNVVYCATKHALMAFSKGLRMELGDKIRVTSISPGAVNTEFIDQTTNEELLQQYKEYFRNSLNPNEVAKQIVWSIQAPDEVLISEIIVRPNRPVK